MLMHGQRFFPEGLPVTRVGYCCDGRREEIRVVRKADVYQREREGAIRHRQDSGVSTGTGCAQGNHHKTERGTGCSVQVSGTTGQTDLPGPLM